MSVENPNKKTMTKKEIVGQYILMGLATYGAIELVTNSGLTSWIADRIDRPLLPSPRPGNPVLPTNQEGKRLTDIDNNLSGLIRSSLTAYDQWALFGEQRLQPLLDKRQPKETVEVLDKIAENFLFEGVNTLQASWILGYNQDFAKIDPEGNNLWINDEHFNLKNRYERQLVGIWMQTKISIIGKTIDMGLLKGKKDSDVTAEEEILLQRTRLQEDLRLLSWLVKRDAPVKMTDESYVFFPREELIAIARVSQVVDRIGLNIPKSIEWCSNDCLDSIIVKSKIIDENGVEKEKVSKGAGGISRPRLDAVKLKNMAPMLSFTHEIGHLVSDKNGFLDRFKQIEDSPDQNKEVRLKHISDYAMNNVDEDFAETFSLYLLEGDYFRSLLEELKVYSPSEGQVLQEKYDFMKNQLFSGTEFSKDGRMRVPFFEEQEGEFAGITWLPEQRILEIHPNTDIFPGMRQAAKTIPVLTDGGTIKNVQVSFNYDPKNKWYQVGVSNSELINKIILFPFFGDDRTLLKGGVGEMRDPLGEKGKDGSIEFVSLRQPNQVGFLIESLSSVQIGQKRKIMLSEDPKMYPLLTNDYQFGFLNHDDVVDIVDGPRTSDPKTSPDRLVKKMWYVSRENEKYKGWVPEEFVTSEVNKK